MQGPVPPSLGSQLALEVADLSNNLLEGPLNALTSEIIDNSRLYRLNLANNRLSGPVSGMQNLGVFREVVGIHRHTSTHVLNISANNFEGDLPFLYYAATSVGGASQLPRLDVRISQIPLFCCIITLCFCTDKPCIFHCNLAIHRLLCSSRKDCGDAAFVAFE